MSDLLLGKVSRSLDADAVILLPIEAHCSGIFTAGLLAPNMRQRNEPCIVCLILCGITIVVWVVEGLRSRVRATNPYSEPE